MMMGPSVVRPSAFAVQGRQHRHFQLEKDHVPPLVDYVESDATALSFERMNPAGSRARARTVERTASSSATSALGLWFIATALSARHRTLRWPNLEEALSLRMNSTFPRITRGLPPEGAMCHFPYRNRELMIAGQGGLFVGTGVRASQKAWTAEIFSTQAEVTAILRRVN
jgi:hypothetical protein